MADNISQDVQDQINNIQLALGDDCSAVIDALNEIRTIAENHQVSFEVASQAFLSDLPVTMAVLVHDLDRTHEGPWNSLVQSLDQIGMMRLVAAFLRRRETMKLLRKILMARDYQPCLIQRYATACSDALFEVGIPGDVRFLFDFTKKLRDDYSNRLRSNYRRIAATAL